MAQLGSLKNLARAASKWVFAAADFPFRNRPGPRVLIYHQVGSAMGRQMEVTVEAFRSQLEWMLEHGTIVTLDEALARAGEDEAHRLFVLTFDDGYRDVYDVAFPLLEAAGAPFLVYATTDPIESGRGNDPNDRDAPLTWGQLAEMAGSNGTVGAHTHTHPDLRVVSPDQALEEMERSDSLIESRLGAPPLHFCYPYGYWAAGADLHVRARYRTATLGAGEAVTSETDPFLVHRVPIQLSDNDFIFRRKMASGLVMEEKVRRRLAGYRGVGL